MECTAVTTYKARVQTQAKHVVRIFPATSTTPETVLVCYEIDSAHHPEGFLIATTKRDIDAGKLVKYQYRVNHNKITAWHVPFLGTDRDPRLNPNMTLSHLCHNAHCYNWEHHTMESRTRKLTRDEIE